MDSYLQRVRKYASTMADTVIPPSDGTNASNAPVARMGNQSDTSWAGWAISSFTNKVTTAKGTMESTTNGHAVSEQNRPESISLPPSGTTTPKLQLSSAKPAQAQANKVAGTSSVGEHADFAAADNESNDAFDAWGTMDDDDDTFFDASASRKATRSPGPSAAFNDGGEPDFAGWLAAQSQAKAKRPLPKGLAKQSAGGGATLAVRPGTAERTISTGSIGSGVGARKLASTIVKPKVTAPVVKKTDTKPAVAEDDWGDAWD